MRRKDRLKEIEKYVSKEFSKHNLDWLYRYHVKLVLELALKLNRIKQGNKEVIILSALLHDIGRIKDNKQHHIVGAKEVRKILKRYDYPESIIEQVSHCIETHRGRERKPKTLEAKIISSADAMAHFKFIPLYFWVRLSIKKMSMEDYLESIRKKIDRDWNQKMLIPEAKEMVKEEYKITCKILDQFQKVKE